VALHLVALHRPTAAPSDCWSTAKLVGDEIRLKSTHAARLLNVNFKPLELKPAPRRRAGMREAGVVGLDYLWVRKAVGSRPNATSNVDVSLSA